MLKAYVGPFIITFLIAMFVFEMQFIWLYLDDLLGKGLNATTVLELIFYASARIVNMALPLAVLMSSIMTFGALGENNELTAMKSAGMSLSRIFRPLVVLMLLLSLGSFFFANNMWPIANLKFRTLLFSIVQQRPALSIENGVFYNGIEGVSIRVMDKNPETGVLKDILIYDHRNQNGGNRTVIRASEGEMTQTEDKRFLILTLKNGSTHDEKEESSKPKRIAGS
ncbi:MAG: YjgP/YjgQ family permease, partial [Bacteroidetes bacterium]|nr:YjgP/YjgQ family permease [Bacteroidota bacterium]